MGVPVTPFIKQGNCVIWRSKYLKSDLISSMSGIANCIKSVIYSQYTYLSNENICECHLLSIYISLNREHMWVSFTLNIHISLYSQYTYLSTENICMTANCIWSVIFSQSKISISLVCFQQNVVKETSRIRSSIAIWKLRIDTPSAIGCT